jgi:hypothetical protein
VYGYGAAIVTESFLHGADRGKSINLTASDADPYPYLYTWPPQEVWNQTAALISTQQNAYDRERFVNLTKLECLRVYNNMYGKRTNVMMVVKDTPDQSGPALLSYIYEPASWYHSNMYWPCGDGEDGGPNCINVGAVTQYNLDHWTKWDHPVLYCVSQKLTTEHCRFNYAPSIMIGKCLTEPLCFRY